MAGKFAALFRKNNTLTTEQLIFKKTWWAFVVFFVMIAAGLGAWKWLQNQPLNGGILGGVKQPIKDGLDLNEKIFNGTLSNAHTAKSYPFSKAVLRARVNGDIGMAEAADTANWKLIVVKAAGDTLLLTLNDIKKLPKINVVHNFKCIEGWSQVTWWSGVRLSDFMQHYGLTKEAAMNYAGLFTPDEEYYVGIDMASALHPQTILCYELNGKPLPLNQGYPLRLIIPVKYGIKSIKRIGTIYFDNVRPPDYWSERGYDYYSGL